MQPVYLEFHSNISFEKIVFQSRQITKHVANLLDSQYNTTKEQRINIVLLKSSMTSRFRKEFKLYKVREINDYHHAHDAYLNAVVATTIMKVYPNLKPQFVYGQYKKTSMFKEEKATARKYFYSNITKFFKKEKVVNDETGEILWDTEKHISIIKRVLSWKQMNIVKKVEKQKGQLWDETINPKGKSDKLIPIKEGLNPKKYGGPKSTNKAYTLVISYKKGENKRKRELFSIPIVDQKDYEDNPVEYLENTGYNKPIILFELPKYQLLELPNGARRMLSSDELFHKANQLVLPDYLVELLYHAKRYNEMKNPESTKYIDEHAGQFRELLEYISKFESEFLSGSDRIEKVKKLYNEFEIKDNELLSNSFVNLLTFTTIGPSDSFRFLETNISVYKYRKMSQFWESTLIFQSITGLYETRYKLEDD